MKQRAIIKVDPVQQGVTIEFLPESGATGAVQLSPEQLLRLIQGLGEAHASLQKERDIPQLEGTEIKAAFNTRWYVQPGLLGEASLLSFYHPAFGPLGFAIPLDQAAQMARLLNNQVDASAQSHATPQ